MNDILSQEEMCFILENAKKAARKQSTVKNNKIQAFNYSNLNQVQLELSAVLGQTKLSFRDILALKEGDIIPLDTSKDQPLSICIEGKPKLEAELVDKNGRSVLRVLK